jgi:serine protease Do
MLRLNRHAASVLLICLPLLFWVQVARSSHLPEFTDLVKATSAAVVNISTTQKVQTGLPQLPEGMEMPEFPEGSPFGELFKYFFNQEGEPEYRDAQSLGSGFIISEDGYVLTNYHVVKDADEIIVRLSDRRELRGEVIGLDQRSDIALLKIDATDLPVVKIGKSAALEVGEWVLAIGSPFGFDHSATAGIVSAKGRSLPSENYVPFIQTDVAINPGNSGGPLLNSLGQLVGVNTAIYSPSGASAGIGFAIPVNTVKDVVPQLIAYGRVLRPIIGVELASDRWIQRYRIPGVPVVHVYPGLPADRAGIRGARRTSRGEVQLGDIIVAVNGRKVRSNDDYLTAIERHKPGDVVEIETRFGEESRRYKVSLVESQ